MSKVIVDPGKIKSIIDTMDYGVVNSSTDLAKVWLEKYNYYFGTLRKPETYWNQSTIIGAHNGKSIFISELSTQVKEEVVDILKQNLNSSQLNHFQRTTIMNKIAEAINEKSALFAQLNFILKGHIQKDTKAIDVPIMVDYFQYYSNWSSLHHSDLGSYIPLDDFVAVILLEETALLTFAISLAASFAAGNRTIIYAQKTSAPLAALLVEICLNAGVPEEDLSIICFEKIEDLNFIFENEFSQQISFFGEKEKIETLTLEHTGPKNIEFFSNGKSSVLVYNDADIHSVCETIVKSSWKHSNQLPWALSTVYVQEAVFESFVKNLKQRMDKLITGDPNNILTDVYIQQNSNTTESLKTFLKNMKLAGAEIYQSSYSNQSENFTVAPTIVIGAKFFETADIPVVQILPFRTVSESISLISNHIDFEFAVSVWTANSSLAKEVSKALRTSTIWNNCFGYISAWASLNMNQKCSSGYFGGKEGLLKYLQDRNNEKINFDKFPSCKKNDSEVNFDTSVISKVEAGKKTFAEWSKKSKIIRANLLRKLAQELENTKKNFSETKTQNDLNNYDSWIMRLNENAARGSLTVTHSFMESYELVQIKEPCGIIVIYSAGVELAIQLITAAIAYGNVVILVLEDTSFITELCKLMVNVGFPANVLIPIKSIECPQVLLKCKEIQKYWIECSDQSYNFINNSVFKLKNSFIFKRGRYLTHETVEMMATKTKSIYSTFGETLTNL